MTNPDKKYEFAVIAAHDPAEFKVVSLHDTEAEAIAEAKKLADADKNIMADAIRLLGSNRFFEGIITPME